MANELTIEAGFRALLMEAGIAMQQAVIDGPAAVANARTPRDTETLADSEDVTPPIIEGNSVTVILSFGKSDDANPKTGQPSATYAVKVHEDMSVPHQTGQSKFLETALLDAAPGFAGEIAARMK